MPEAAYLRFPSVCGQMLAFVADDDVWLAPVDGGMARRLTTDHAAVTSLRLAPAGSLVAYTSTRDGVPEVYVADTDGGPVRRLSYWGDRTTRVVGWTGDGEVIAVSATGEPFRPRTWAYALPVGGGSPERLSYGPISAIALDSGDAVVLGVHQSRSRGAAWKRYRGGTAAALWIDRAGDGTFERYLRELDGQLEDPSWADERVVFVSDHEGVGNVYSALADGSDLRRHTDHADFYARAASCDGRRVVYQCAGSLWRLEELSAGSVPERLEIRLGSARSGRASRSLKAVDEWGAFAPDRTGRASAVEARGAVYWLTHEDGPARLLGGGAGARARFPAVVGRGEATKVVYVTDAGGEDSIEVVAAAGPDAAPAGPAGPAGHTGRVATPAGPDAATPAGPDAATPAGPDAAAPAGPDAAAPAGPDAAALAGPDAAALAGPDAAAPAGPDAAASAGPDAAGPDAAALAGPDAAAPAGPDAAALAGPDAAAPAGPDAATPAGPDAAGPDAAALAGPDAAAPAGPDAATPAGPDAAGPAGTRRFGTGQVGRVVALSGAPDGSYAALATHDGRVILVDLVSGLLRTIDESAAGVASGLTFSPDSKWLAWSHAGQAPLRHIKLAAVESGDVVDATPLRFEDRDPVFTLDGRYLAFLSARTFDPVYDAQVLDMSFVSATRPYLLTLAASTPSPFDAEREGRRRRPAARADRTTSARANDSDRSDGEPVVARVDPDGLAERVVPFPVAAGRYVGLRAAKDGLIWLTEPLLGVLGEERASPAADQARSKVVRYDLENRTEIVLVDAADAFRCSGDGRSMVVRDGKKLLVLPADHRVDPGATSAGADQQEKIDVDLSRIRLELDPPREWRQMYDEAARMMRDRFWVEDMAGVDWAGVVERYRALLDRIATRDDLSDLLWEVQGELGASHAYEVPPEPKAEPEWRMGFLGADLERDAEGGWRVGRILNGESSVPAARSPLTAPGVTIRAGDAIVAIDGRPVDPELGPQALLVGAADTPIEVTYRSDEDGAVGVAVLQPLAEEMPLRYHAWVAGRRSAVHAASDGRVGYVHVPDMMGLGWAQLNRDLRLEVAREALIVDARYNGGGHISELVLEAIERVVHGWDMGRHLLPEPYPSKASRGPRVLVTNEYAGSDGDIVTAGFMERHLGPVVGTRTWGGVIGFDDYQHLVDGSSVTQPQLSFWFYGLEWGVENYGVAPDVEVAMAPQDWTAGRDTQLDKAVELALEGLRTSSVSTPPDVATRPSRVPPPLPPRP